MKVQTTTKELREALSKAGGFVPARAVLPTLQNVLVEVRGKKALTMSATDLEKAITVQFEGRATKPGAICLPAKALSRIISTLPNGEIALAVKGQTATISCGNTEITLEGQDPQDFPPMPKREGMSFTIDAQALAKAIRRTTYACAKEESRPILTGVSLEAEGGKATFAAADGFRLTVQETVAKGNGEHKGIIPGTAMVQVARVIGKTTDKVGIVLNAEQHRGFFTFGGIEIVTRLIQGTFPDYRQLIPKEWTTRAVWGRAEITEAVETVAKFKPTSEIVRLIVDNNGTLLTAKEEETGEISLKVPTRVEGEAGKIAINIPYLMAALKACGGDEISLEFTQPHNPMVFRQVGDDGYLVVVMPIFVNW